MGRPSALRPVALANATELLRSRRYTSLRTLSLPDDLDDVDRWLIGTHHELRMDEQARALGVTYAIVSYWRVGLSRRGLLDARMRAGNAPITAAEADAIARLYRDGYSRLSIAALREISMGRVVAALEKAGALGAPRLVRLNAARVSALLGIGRADVLRWVARGWLPDYRVRNVPGARHAWDLDDLVALVRNRDSWVAWSPAQITSTELRALAERERRTAGGAWLQQGEIAALLGVDSSSLRRWITDDGLFGEHTLRRWTGAHYRWLSDADQAALTAMRVRPHRLGSDAHRWAANALRSRLRERFGPLERATAAD